MEIILDPMPHDFLNTSVSVAGLIVTVDDIEYDLSIIPEGGQAEADEGGPFIGVVTRNVVRIRYYYDMNKAEPLQSTDWNDYTFGVEEGEVPCPIKWLPDSKLEVSETSKAMSHYQPVLPYTGGNDVSEEH